MNEIKDTGIVIVDGTLGPCRVYRGEYASNKAPALILRQNAGERATVPVTQNIPELRLTDAVVFKQEYEQLAAVLVDAKVIVPAETSVLDRALAGDTPVNDMAAELLTAQIYTLNPARPEENPEPAETAPRPGKPRPASPLDEEFPTGHPLHGISKQIKQVMDDRGMSADMRFITSFNVPAGSTVQAELSVHNADNPALDPNAGGGKRDAVVDKDAVDYLNTLPGMLDTPQDYVTVRTMLRDYLQARDALDTAIMVAVARMLALLPEEVAHRGVEMLLRLDRGIANGLAEHTSDFMAGKLPKDVVALADLRRVADERRKKFAEAMREADGDVQKAMLFMSVAELPEMLRKAASRLTKDKSKGQPDNG